MVGDRSLRRTGRPPAPAPEGPLDALAGLVDLVGGESDRSRRFLGGLIAGALVGAAVVGATASALRRRRGENGPRTPGR